MSRTPHNPPIKARAQQSPYPSGQFSGSFYDNQQVALLSLSHTPHEDQLYRAMLTEVVRNARPSMTFSIRQLRTLTGINSPTTVRRALSGLLRKLSIENVRGENPGRASKGHHYQIFKPEEIFERRRASGLPSHAEEFEVYTRSAGFKAVIERVALKGNLSRREAQVALACAQGMTNARIARHLSICEQTVKFHLRNIFTKFGVSRRTELIYLLLAHEAKGPG